MIKRDRSTGFTIVELLIVIVVIAILAAIVIVTYNGIQKQAKNTQILVAMDGWEKTMRAYYATTGSYPIDSNDGADGSYCLGADFSAKDGFSSNDCIMLGGSSFGYTYSPEVISQLASIAKVPNIDFSVTEVELTESLTMRFRGIAYYISTRDNLNGGEVSISYYIDSEQICGRGIKLDMSSEFPGLASCTLYLKAPVNF